MPFAVPYLQYLQGTLLFIPGVCCLSHSSLALSLPATAYGLRHLCQVERERVESGERGQRGAEGGASNKK